jgi:hypothetical protein
MNDQDDLEVVSGELMSGPPPPDRAALLAENLERARKLGRRLGVKVLIDDTGWLGSEVELVFTKELDRTLRLVLVRVGADAADHDVLGDGGVVIAVDQYNASLGALRGLAARLAHLVRQGRVCLVPGSPAAYAHAHLSRLDEQIDRRQRLTMGHGIVLIMTLRREAEFFARCDAHLAPIVSAVSAGKRGPRPVRRWLDWWRARIATSRRVQR